MREDRETFLRFDSRGGRLKLGLPLLKKWLAKGALTRRPAWRCEPPLIIKKSRRLTSSGPAISLVSRASSYLHFTQQFIRACLHTKSL